ncbi:uncharacterized protein Dwil_GK24556 [Drosophila willistoni]|uniref:WD repeat-containing protein 55 homolog n=1 Tax=Drosophila willistoni TaxID=7260 RepID=B4N740_DROWI|nr:U3 small nucleolar RNA-associated protein 4 homolog [Drosophila willistoni]EDW80179.1 uncharacterized protein Dwil_GK24556 [Drosophila willistoni]
MKPDFKEAPQEGGRQQLHNVRFYTIRPRGIDCMAYNKSEKSLAVCREGYFIELWNLQHTPYLDRVIYLQRKARVEDLAWSGKRLFTVSLQGKLIEWNVEKGEAVAKISPTGNAIWCVAVNLAGTDLAVGTEEGHINILSIENNEITHKSIFVKQRGRVLCCKFDKSGKRLVTGCEGYVKIWNVAKGTTIHTMTLSDKQVIVWSILVLSDNTIITGDSAGFVSVWNGQNGTQIERQQVLDKNVFALAINEDENRLACSGMQPPLIRILNKTQIKREDATFDRWIKFLQRDPHKHYVKSLAMIPNGRIVSGGQDGILTISPSERMRGYACQHAPFLKGSVVSVAAAQKLVLLRYSNSLHLWRLGTAKQKETIKPGLRMNTLAIGHTEDLLLEQPPQKLVQLNVRQYKFCRASAISPDGKWICYSTHKELRLYRLHTDILSIQRKFQSTTNKLHTDHIIFSADSQRLVVLNQNQAKFFAISEDNLTFLYHVMLGPTITANVNHLLLSPCGNYLVAASSDNVVAIWQHKENRHPNFKLLLTLPRHQAGTTALAMHENEPRLVVAYADGRIVEYDLLNSCFTCESEEYLINTTHSFVIKGIVLDSNNPNMFIVYNELYIYSMEKYSNNEDNHLAKSAKLSKESRAVVAKKPMSLKVKSKILRHHLVHVARLNANELVNVSIQTSNLLASLPPPYERKKFGAS